MPPFWQQWEVFLYVVLQTGHFPVVTHMDNFSVSITIIFDKYINIYNY